MKFALLATLSLFLSACQLPPEASPADNDAPTPQAPSPSDTLEHTAPKAIVLSEASSEPVKVQTITPEPIEPPTAQEVEDLWQRISMQLSMPIPLDEPRIQAQLKWYAKHPNYMKTISERAAPYLFFIVEELEKRQMPLELALLPIVESAYRPFAYSHGQAAGLWQIIPATGTRFGLEQNWWYDGRRDVYASTMAALDYLQYLNRFFDGDWSHAIAAYNSGEGRVRNAVRSNKKAGKATDFWQLSLPKETSAYLPKLLAISHMLQNRDSVNMHIPALSNQAHLSRVNIGSQIDLALAADLAGLKLEDLQMLNPGFNRWATAPEGPHFLLLPIKNAPALEHALAQLPQEERLQWARYKVKSGDTLSHIAHSYNTTSELIRRLNQLSNNSIRIGQALLIPVSSRSASEYSLTVEQRLKSRQAQVKGAIKLNHRVESGDSLWTIARKFDVDHRQLAKWNNMAPGDTLRLGANLVIWQQSKIAKAHLQTIHYSVRDGDNLSLIAARYKVSVNDVLRWNNLKSQAYLKPGQRLKLYVDVTRLSS